MAGLIFASVLDVCTRKIVGYSYGRKNGSFSCYFCTDKFMAKIRTIQIMLFFTATVEASILLLSILRSLRGWASDFLTVKKGCPFDNAPMESFHSVLKKEEVYLKHYSSFYEANIRPFDYINGFFIILIAFTGY